MKYKKIVSGIFLSRPNRFISHVEIEGKEEIVHVKNTGRCKELLIPGTKVYLEDFEGRMGTRKLRYSLIAVEKCCKSNKTVADCERYDSLKDCEAILINIDSQAPNKVVGEWLATQNPMFKSTSKSFSCPKIP